MRILVVEDEVSMAESLRSGLTAKGFAVDVASDGEEARVAGHLRELVILFEQVGEGGVLLSGVEVA